MVRMYKYKILISLFYLYLFYVIISTVRFGIFVKRQLSKL